MKIVCLVKKKNGLTSEQFKDYYENKHAPLALKLLPFFSSYYRNYVIKDTDYKPAHLDEVRPPAPDFDVITEISFASRELYEGMLAALKDPIVGKIIADDERNFLDRKAVVMFFVDEKISAVEATVA